MLQSYEGNFEENEINGKGVFYFKDGDVFEGTCQWGSFVQGVYRYANGQTYTGKTMCSK